MAGLDPAIHAARPHSLTFKITGSRSVSRSPAARGTLRPGDDEGDDFKQPPAFSRRNSARALRVRGTERRESAQSISVAPHDQLAKAERAERATPHGAPSRRLFGPGRAFAGLAALASATLLAGGPSAAGRSPETARCRACEARQRAPHPAPLKTTPRESAPREQDARTLTPPESTGKRSRKNFYS